MAPERPVTVLYILNSASTGGANRSLGVLLRGLDRARWRPIAVVPRDGPLLPRLEELRVPVRRLTLPGLGRQRASLLGRAKAAVRNALHFARLVRHVRREQVRIIHTNTVFPLGGALVARLLGLPHVWHLREGLDTPEYDLRFGRRISRLLIGALSDRTVCISQYVRTASVPERALARAVVIPNALEDRPPLRPWPPRNRPVIGTVGHIGSKKRTLLFVEAAGILARSHPEARFVVVGRPTSGEEDVLARAQARVAELGLTGSFEFAGEVADPAELYARMTLLAHPGVHEGFGRVLIEAMVRGMPVVGVRSGATEEILEHERTGLLVPPDDPDALAAAMARLLGDAPFCERLGENARAAALARFDPAQHVRAVAAVYDDVLDGAR